MPAKQRRPSDRILSLKTTNTLEIETRGIAKRDEEKCTQLIGHFIEEYFLGYKSVTSGGRAEGTALGASSDSDVMGVIPGFLVADDCHEGAENNMFMYTREDCYPGYCKLKCSTEHYELFKSLNLVCNSLEIEPAIQACIEKCIVNSNGSYFISSKKFTENAIPSGMIPADKFNEISYEVNDPAVTNVNIDYVQAFEMNEWPKEAKIWRTRHRDNNWPSEEVLTRLEADIACYVVPVGNRNSANFDNEWRLSFVEVERELIWSMNETQFKCFVILKRLKEKFVKYSCLKDITTYHLKNIIFWMCEEVPECDWKPPNLISCVKKCLKKLRTCMNEGRLNHYIIPENNLFQSKTFEYKIIYKALNKIIENVLYELLLDICEDGIGLQNLLLVSPKVLGYSDRCKTICGICATAYDPDFPVAFLKKFSEAKILLPCVQITQAKAKWRRELIEISVGKDDISLSTTGLARTVVSQIKEGHEMDFCTSSISAAIVYFRHGNYEEVLNELKTILSVKTWKIYPSSLGNPVYLRFDSGEMHIKKKEHVCGVDDIQKDRNNLVSDFCAVFIDLYTLPYPLELQLCVSGTRGELRCNPVVISYYLLYMSQLMLNDRKAMGETMHRFKTAVRYNLDRRDYYLSLVLLGHSLYWTGDIKAAFQCFAKSIREKKSVRNVAVYHMAFLINDVSRGVSELNIE